jgi:hypothetical protein
VVYWLEIFVVEVYLVVGNRLRFDRYLGQGGIYLVVGGLGGFQLLLLARFQQNFM